MTDFFSGWSHLDLGSHLDPTWSVFYLMIAASAWRRERSFDAVLTMRLDEPIVNHTGVNWDSQGESGQPGWIWTVGVNRDSRGESGQPGWSGSARVHWHENVNGALMRRCESFRRTGQPGCFYMKMSGFHNSQSESEFCPHLTQTFQLTTCIN